MGLAACGDDYFTPATKQKHVVPTVSDPLPICPPLSPVEHIGDTPHDIATPSRSPPPASNPSLAKSLLVRLKNAIDSMPTSIPDAKEDDVLAAFATSCPPVDLVPDEAWEELDPILNRLVGYGVSVEEFAGTVRRGRLGMVALWKFLHAWVDQYRIEGKLLEGKVSKLITAIEIA